MPFGGQYHLFQHLPVVKQTSSSIIEVNNYLQSYICAQRVHLPIQVGADSKIQVGSDSILLWSVVYKFVTTNTFNCHGTIAYIIIIIHLLSNRVI